jgi:mono/diheme cytochrome c family protein
MFRRLLVGLGFPLIVVCSLDAFHPAQVRSPYGYQTPGPKAAAESVPSDRALIDKYCVSCHNGRLKTAGLALDGLDISSPGENAATWEKVVKKLRSGTMPPAGRPRPDPATYAALATSLETALDRAAAAHPNPGRPPLHRLNRAEYTNAIRDLLALDIDGRSLLPPDDSGYGFDNIADVLSISPALLEQYMNAAGKISRLAIGDASMRPVVETYNLRPTLLQDDRMGEDLPFDTRGGMAVRHYFPVDGEYQLKIRLRRTHSNQIRGLGEPNQIEVRLDRARVKEFTVGGEGPRNPWGAVASASLYEQTADDGLELRLRVNAGSRLITVAFPRKSGVPEGVLEPRLSVGTYEFAGDRDSYMSVATVQITGPYNGTTPKDTPSRRRIFVCSPSGAQDEDACAKKILTTLARRAFRRPVTDRDLDPLVEFYRRGRAKGSFEAGIELALRTVLVDSDFLFRAERARVGVPGSVHRLSDIELASRLSFFLWSSIPDDQLLELAERGTLSSPTVLRQQVARMLADDRSAALIGNFVGQWLHLRNMATVTPDPDEFPEFDENLREAMQRETELFVESQLREDRSVVDLLSADYTFLNERLARHYGVPNVYGSHFRRVTLTDPTRRGLLGQGSILTVTSYANRTAPTIRGKWMLENLLGAPPPPPPPNVPSLEEATPGKHTSVRERLEQHRKNAVCASCHAPMDPLGLALENFDAIGKWRTRDGNTTIDPSGGLPDGSTFSGPAGVRQLLLGRREQFVSTVAEKLLTYAMGRGLEYYDAPAVRAIMREAAPSDYHWSSLILAIVKSTPFQMRRSSES